jgi:hypothetical protein
MLLGIMGIVLGLLGAPAPVLSCLLLVGLGADADLARRAMFFDDAGIGRYILPIRSLHAGMYVWLYVVGWLAMADAATSVAGHTWLLFDLTISLLLLGAVTFSRRQLS